MKLRPGTPEEVGMSAERIQHVADLAESWVAQGVHSALVVLVARKGVIVLHEAFGRLTPEVDSPPLQLDSIFPVASVTKPVTATAAMILVEDGLLGLNRPVSEYIPEFVGEGKDAVMVHHLLTHTTGLRDDVVFAHVERKKEGVVIPPPHDTQHPTLHEWLFLGYDTPLWKPPGREMSYSVYGYELVGEIIRRVSGRSLGDFARDRIFMPLGMRDTSYAELDRMKHRVVRRPPDAPFASPDWPGFEYIPLVRALVSGLGTRRWQETPRASGGVHSTAMDMAVFGQMFLNHGAYDNARILSPASVAEMTRNQIPGISSHYLGEFIPEASWGFGWGVHGNKKTMYYNAILQSQKAFAHGGLGGAYMWVDPVYDVVGVYLSIALKTRPNHAHITWCADLFASTVTAAVVDVNSCISTQPDTLSCRPATGTS